MAAPRKPVRDGEGRPLALRLQPGYYAGFSTMKQKGYWDEATRTLVEQRVASNNPELPKALKFFTAEEEPTMRAAVDRIVPQDDRTPERRIDLLAGIDDRLAAGRMDGYRYVDMPSDQDAYRLAAKALHVMAFELYKAPFAELETVQQETILQQLHDAEPKAAQHLWEQMNLMRFWSMFASDCVAVYYAHPWAWDEVGFGGPAYPRGYMRLEEGEPEPWEVDEQRYEWQAPEDTISGKPQKGGA